jgi:hypothetical protein
MIQVSLYINSQIVNNTTGAITDNWINADLDDNVNIVLNDSIKDAKDVGKVMTAYTNQFKLPASKKNNRIFKYFHNHNVLNGFDARRKHEAIIKLNGFDYKKGYIKLNKVDLKDNSPLAYNIQFFGELASLKDILGDADLKDLTSLAKYNHEYSLANARSGLEKGLAFDFSGASPVITESVDGDIKYPLISHTRLFEYDSQGFHKILSQDEIDSGEPIPQSYRLSYTDLKPAIKVARVIDAIQETFPQIRFDKSWIESQYAKFGSPFDDLFMWLHRDKGYITYGEEIGDRTFWANLKDGTGEYEYDYSSGTTTGILPLNTFFAQYNARNYVCEFELIPYGSGSNQVVVILVNQGIVHQTIVRTESGTITIDFEIPFDPDGDWEIITQIFPSEDVSVIKPKLTITRIATDEPDITAIYGNTQVGLVKDIIVPLLMPKKKIIDFLSDLFKMFNLVAQEVRQDDGSYKIYIESLDSYYKRGTAYDITQYIDISSSSVERISPYGIAKFAFPEPKTFLAINQRQITGDDFGDVSFRVSDFDEGTNSSSSLLFDGGEYKVEPKFEKMMYERLNSRTNNQQTNIQLGLYVNDNKENIPEPVVGDALLFYTYKQNTSSATEYISWDDGNNSLYYNKPSNVKPDNSQTLHFNEEFDEWTLATNPNSLFNKFYRNYIAGIYSPYARRINVTCYLPPLIFSKVKLNDTMIIDRIPFLIEKIKTNFKNGKTSLDLLRVTDIEQTYVVPEEGQLVWNTDEDTWDERIDKWDGIINRFSSYIEEILGDFEARVDKDGGVLDSSIGCVESAIRSLPDAETARVLFDAYDARCKAESGDTEARTCAIASLNEILL